MPGPFEQRLRPTAELTTSVRLRGDRSIYEVQTANALYRDRLQHMGFAPAGEGGFRRDLSATGDVLRTHRNFARHLEEMLLQSARLRPVPWEDTLDLILRRVQGTRLRWFLYGSGALAVRGVDVDPGDLDLWVDDAYLAGDLFEDLLVEPVTVMTGWVADLGGRAFAGCLFEWLAGVHPDIDQPAPHEQGPHALGHLEQVSWRGALVAVPPLELQLAVAERRSLTERAAKIRAFIAGSSR
ncbi:MAG TPA: hypothetical protein VHW05_16500 [Phenylobacterium sp.]|nr:hypothetical protein [Phenylobacterium sp.]